MLQLWGQACIYFVCALSYKFIENSLRPSGATLECQPWREVISTIPIYRWQWQLYCPNLLPHSSPRAQLHWLGIVPTAICPLLLLYHFKILVAKKPLDFPWLPHPKWFILTGMDVGAPLPTPLPSTTFFCTQLTNTKQIAQEVGMVCQKNDVMNIYTYTTQEAV